MDRVAIRRERSDVGTPVARTSGRAKCTMLDGPIYAPVFERYEREIDALRAREDAMSGASDSGRSRYLEFRR
jgi:hypothetical protein